MLQYEHKTTFHQIFPKLFLIIHDQQFNSINTNTAGGWMLVVGLLPISVEIRKKFKKDTLSELFTRKVSHFSMENKRKRS